MAPRGTHRKETCTKCFKWVKMHLRCFKCDAIYHAKCLLKAPGFQADQYGHAFCCRNVPFKGHPAKEGLVQQENLVIVKREEGYDSDKDLENYLPEEEDLERNEFKCAACYLGFGNKGHLEGHYRECPYIQGEAIQEINKASSIGSFSKEGNFQEESYEENTKQCTSHDSQLDKVIDTSATNAKKDSAQHTSTHHGDKEKRFKCSVCNFSTHVKHCLVTHERIHNNEKPFKCDVCEYTAIQASALKRHFFLKHYDGEKKYKCPDCPFSAHIKQYLARHMHVHTNARPFKCDECDYTTPYSSHLKTHVLLKHYDGEKRYKCGFCEYSTHIKQRLTAHTSTHTNERPFKCDKCDYTTSRKKFLPQHFLLKH